MRVCAVLREFLQFAGTSIFPTYHTTSQTDSCCPEAAQCGAPARAPSHPPGLLCPTSRRASGFSRRRCRTQGRRHLCRNRSGRCPPDFRPRFNLSVFDFQVTTSICMRFAGNHGHRVVVAACKQWHPDPQTRGIFGSHSAPTSGGLG